jgi:hypothetical protein
MAFTEGKKKEPVTPESTKNNVQLIFHLCQNAHSWFVLSAGNLPSFCPVRQEEVPELRVERGSGEAAKAKEPLLA